MTITDDIIENLDPEQLYLYLERIGILSDGKPITEDMKKLAYAQVTSE